MEACAESCIPMLVYGIAIGTLGVVVGFLAGFIITPKKGKT